MSESEEETMWISKREQALFLTKLIYAALARE
jgi:hypothetical protein